MEKEIYEIVGKAKKYDELSFIYKSGTLHCSFCGKRQEDVNKIVAGRSVYICNECIELCNEIVNEDKASDDSIIESN